MVHRKVTNGICSKWGARAHANLQIVISTAGHKGKVVFQALVDLMRAPVSPFLEGSSL
jgi:hypothetical protein